MNNQLKITIATDFSDAPGARYKKDGPDSGELFFEKLLEPGFKTALQENKKLLIDLDGTYGYATSFLSEAFGKLSKGYGAKQVESLLIIKSDEDPTLIKFILDTIHEK